MKGVRFWKTTRGGRQRAAEACPAIRRTAAGDEVVAKGPPWRTRLMLCGTIYLETPAGAGVRAPVRDLEPDAWGLLRQFEVYEDTENSTAVDEYLMAIGELEPAVGAPVASAA